MAKRLSSGEFQGDRRCPPNLRRSCQAVNPGAGEGMSAAAAADDLVWLKEGVNEEVLLEILARLPNSRNAVQAGLVCHLWHSLISQQHFIPRFIGLREQKKIEQPYSIIFRIVDALELEYDGDDSDEFYQPICKLFSEESVLLHGEVKEQTVTSRTSYPPSGGSGGIQPPSPNMVIRASCADLLLLSEGERDYAPELNSYYLCNPVTKQWFHLPHVYFGDYLIGLALARMPPAHNSCGSYEYKVAFIRLPYKCGDENFAGDSWMFRMPIYCSKSRQWSDNSWYRYPIPATRRTPKPRPRLFINPIACNGTIYWLNCDDVPDCIIACDLVNKPYSSAFINLPEGSMPGGRGVVSLELGAVLGELRLFNVFRPSSRHQQQPRHLVVVKVWELNHTTNCWTLVHDTRFNDRPPPSPHGIQLEEENKFKIRTLAFHPNDGDVVFLVCGCGVFQYRISQGVYEKVDELPAFVPPDAPLTPFTLLHSIWPTTMLFPPE